MLCALPAQAEVGKLAVDSLQSTLAQSHAAWSAKENWVSRLPLDQLRRMMGLRNPPTTDVEFEAPRDAVRALGATPATFDWRNKDGINWVSPILNQGNCGSCVAFATVGVLESQVNITSGIPGLNPSFSTQALFACGGGSCDFGWYPDAAANYLTQTGVPDEACAPYTSGSTGQDVSCSSVCSDAASRSLRLVGSSTPTTGSKDIEGVKAALMHGPLVTTMTVYADFIAYSSGIYKHVKGDSLGGHAVAIVGYDSNARYWIVRNNWGADWGEGGFFRVSWDDVSGIGNETWSYEVPQNQGYVSVRNPHGRKFVSGIVNLDAESTFPQSGKLQLTVQSEDGSVRQNLPLCDRSPCTVPYDTAPVPNGKYDIFASVNWGQGDVAVSEHEQFFVFNGKPSPSLSFAMEDGVDLSQPLKDRIVFDITSSSGNAAVPLSSVTLHIAKNGKELLTKTSYLVLPQMTLGWRTNSIPDGKYEIWLTGALQTSSVSAQAETKHYTVTTSNGV